MVVNVPPRFDFSNGHPPHEDLQAEGDAQLARIILPIIAKEPGITGQGVQRLVKDWTNVTRTRRVLKEMVRTKQIEATPISVLGRSDFEYREANA